LLACSFKVKSCYFFLLCLFFLRKRISGLVVSDRCKFFWPVFACHPHYSMMKKIQPTKKASTRNGKTPPLFFIYSSLSPICSISISTSLYLVGPHRGSSLSSLFRVPTIFHFAYLTILRIVRRHHRGQGVYSIHKRIVTRTGVLGFRRFAAASCRK